MSRRAEATNNFWIVAISATASGRTSSPVFGFFHGEGPTGSMLSTERRSSAPR